GVAASSAAATTPIGTRQLGATCSDVVSPGPTLSENGAEQWVPQPGDHAACTDVVMGVVPTLATRSDVVAPVAFGVIGNTAVLAVAGAPGSTDTEAGPLEARSTP